LVENAIVHGIGKRIEGGEIRVTLSECQGVLSISLYNDGPALGDSGSDKAGVGLSNTRGRLAALYGPGSSVELRNGRPTGVETIVTLPYRTVA
jgi:LytS/YehU family sensor histidine kinase